MVINNLRAIKDFSNLKEIAINKQLAKLGDNFVNFIYSIAKSCVLGQFTGWKLPDRVLAQALRDADLRFLLSTKASAHDLGDAVESLIVHSWIFQKLSLEELTTILYNHLKTGDFSDQKKEERSAIQAFTAVLLEIKNLV